jgi:3-oxoacyl-[acyl-carrier-protein] synthase III
MGTKVDLEAIQLMEELQLTVVQPLPTMLERLQWHSIHQPTKRHTRQLIDKVTVEAGAKVDNQEDTSQTTKASPRLAASTATSVDPGAIMKFQSSPN